MNLVNGVCVGVTIGGSGTTVSNSYIGYNSYPNGAQCTISQAPPGAGVYTAVGSATWLNPQILNNVFESNGGPALDADGVWGGTFSGNTVRYNYGWAAVSLYGSSYWTIANNPIISHPATGDIQPYHPSCQTGPAGNYSAAIFLCQDTDAGNKVTIGNIIRDNGATPGVGAVASFYGILLIGYDEPEGRPYGTPRNNQVLRNNVVGSYFGCADDFQPGQWFSDQNVWSGNNCAGPGTDVGPVYF